ncbi:MAG TPA: hypothetical protein VMY77_04455, partial [Chitinophagaceae bacterium]|nr:hypothetical protein [Chitinophagaceae bacterium]
MKTSSFFKNLSWLILLNLLVKPVWIFFIDRQVQVTVGYETYGKYFALLNLSYVLLFLADAGLSNLIGIRIANVSGIHPGQMFRVKVALLFMYCLSCFLIAWVTGVVQWLLVYIVAVQVLNSLFLFLRSMVAARQYFGADAWFSILDKGLMILLCGAFLYTSTGENFTIIRFLELQIVCTSLAVVATLIFLWQKRMPASTEPQKTRNILIGVIPFAAIILLMSMHYRLDGFLLERIHPDGAEQAGIYAAAYRLLDAGN